MHEWKIYGGLEQASKAAANFLVENIQDCLAKRGECHIALPGGNTPATCLELLSQASIAWNKVHWYLGDERCLPIGNVERNDVMLNQHLFSRTPESQVHKIPAELGPDKAAEFYSKIIDNLISLDIVFLGMGEDGHTASLFPGNAALQDKRSVVPVFDSPKPPDQRVSLGVETLRSAKLRVVLTAGATKQSIISKVENGMPLPVNMIGDIHWFVDKASMAH